MSDNSFSYIDKPKHLQELNDNMDSQINIYNTFAQLYYLYEVENI